MIRSLCEVSRIYLMLGLACNFKCSYCHQKFQEIPHLEKSISDQLLRFLENVAAQQVRQNGKVSTLRVNLFGGEPLLYFGTIKQLVKSVRASNIEWAVVSNGALLTREMVDFINAHKIRFYLSHDGVRTLETRGANVLNNSHILDLLKEIRDLSFDSVLSPFNQDPYALREYLEAIFERKIRLKMSFMMVHGELPDRLLDFHWGEWEQTCRRMGDAALSQFLSKSEGWESDFYRKYIFQFYDFMEGKSMWNGCGTRGGKLNLDLSGRVWLCDNAIDQIGTVSSPCLELSYETDKRFDALYEKNKLICLQCQWLPYCHGHCPREQMTKQALMKCRFMGVFFQSVKNVMTKFERELENASRGVS